MRILTSIQPKKEYNLCMTSEKRIGLLVPLGFESDLPDETGGVFTDDTLNGIRQDAAIYVSAKYGSTNTWKGPVVVDYKPQDSITGDGKNVVVSRDNDMLLDVCVVLDPWAKSELNVDGEGVEKGEMALGIIVLLRENYTDSRVPYERKAELQQKYGVVPIDGQHVLFQGLLRDVRPEDSEYMLDPNGLVFKYIPRDIITGEEISRPYQEMQKNSCV